MKDSVEVPLEVVRERVIREVELEHLKRALSYTAGNRRRAAELLGISYKTLLAKLRKYGLD